MLIDDVMELFEGSELELGDIAFIAERLGIDADAISEKHLQNLTDELNQEVKRFMPNSSNETLREIVNFLQAMRVMRSHQEKQERGKDTGIFIRATVEGKTDNFDIGDPKLPTGAIMSWLRSGGGENSLAENTVLALLGRARSVAE